MYTMVFELHLIEYSLWLQWKVSGTFPLVQWLVGSPGILFQPPDWPEQVEIQMHGLLIDSHRTSTCILRPVYFFISPSCWSLLEPYVK